MNFKRMRVLIAVHHAGSLSGAAKALHYTTSAVSQQVAALEREAEHPLIERTPRGIRVTDAGRIVVRHAERMERVLEAARRELDDVRDLKSGSLRLGTFPSFTRSILPGVLAEFTERHPGVEVRLKSDTREGLRQRLESGEIDVAFLWDYPWAPLQSSGDEEIALLCQDPCVLLLPEGHALAGQVEVAVSEMRGEPWIVRATSAGRDMLRRVCASADFEPQIVFDAHTYEEVQSMVAANVGIAVVPNSTVSRSGFRLSVTALADAPVRRIYHARRRHSRMTPALGAMNSILRNMD
jgi:molybdate transport repressor ModE-like protein